MGPLVFRILVMFASVSLVQGNKGFINRDNLSMDENKLGLKSINELGCVILVNQHGNRDSKIVQ